MLDHVDELFTTPRNLIVSRTRSAHLREAAIGSKLALAYPRLSISKHTYSVRKIVQALQKIIEKTDDITSVDGVARALARVKNRQKMPIDKALSHAYNAVTIDWGSLLTRSTLIPVVYQCVRSMHCMLVSRHKNEQFVLDDERFANGLELFRPPRD